MCVGLSELTQNSGYCDSRCFPQLAGIVKVSHGFWQDAQPVCYSGKH